MEHTHLKEKTDNKTLLNMYTSCDDIPLNLFIDVYCGDVKKLLISGNADEYILQLQRAKLISEYSLIIGGKSALYEIKKQAELIDYNTKINIFTMCLNLLKLDSFENVSEILSKIKIKVKDKEDAINKCNSNLAECKLRLDMLKRKINTESKVEINKSYFTKEMAIVMAHYKMVINPKEVTASIYGNWIRLMLDEIKDKQNG